MEASLNSATAFAVKALIVCILETLENIRLSVFCISTMFLQKMRFTMTLIAIDQILTNGKNQICFIQ